MTEKHSILGNKVYVYKRENSSVWQCSSYLNVRNRRAEHFTFIREHIRLR